MVPALGGGYFEGKGIVIGSGNGTIEGHESTQIIIGNNACVKPGGTGYDDGSVVIGENAFATGGHTVAIGHLASASVDSIAMGVNACACGYGSTALGAYTYASVEYSTAVGYQAFATGTNSTAWGHNTCSSGESSTALGHCATTSGHASTALGYWACASGCSSTALGRCANACGDNSTAVGYCACASGVASTALGHGASSTKDNSTALGMCAFALGNYSIALGSWANAFGANSTALGPYTCACTCSLAVGYGSESCYKDSVSVGLRATTTGVGAVAMGVCASADQNEIVLRSVGCMSTTGEYLDCNVLKVDCTGKLTVNGKEVFTDTSAIGNVIADKLSTATTIDTSQNQYSLSDVANALNTLITLLKTKN